MAHDASDTIKVGLNSSAARPGLRFLTDAARIECLIASAAIAVALVSNEPGQGLAWILFAIVITIPLALLCVGVGRLWRRWEGGGEPRLRPPILPSRGRTFALLDTVLWAVILPVLAAGIASSSGAFAASDLVIATPIAIAYYFADRWLAILSWRLGPYGRPVEMPAPL